MAAPTSVSSMLATLGVWSFGAMIAIAAVVAVAALVEDRWPGSVILGPARQVEDHSHRARGSLGELRRSLRRHGSFGRLAWLGMSCGLLTAVGLFIGVPWAALEERARRESRQAVEQDLVTRQCGDFPLIPPSARVIEGFIRDDPEVTEQVDRLSRQYFDCRDRVLGYERGKP